MVNWLLMNEVCCVLKPGGTLFASTPCYPPAVATYSATRLMAASCPTTRWRTSRALRYERVRGKAMLGRLCLADLAPDVFDRPNAGFLLPYVRRLRSRLGRRIDESMRRLALITATGLDPSTVRSLWRAFLDSAPGLYWSRAWALFVFIRCCHQHRVCL